MILCLFFQYFKCEIILYQNYLKTLISLFIVEHRKKTRVKNGKGPYL